MYDLDYFQFADRSRSLRAFVDIERDRQRERYGDVDEELIRRKLGNLSELIRISPLIDVEFATDGEHTLAAVYSTEHTMPTESVTFSQYHTLQKVRQHKIFRDLQVHRTCDRRDLTLVPSGDGVVLQVADHAGYRKTGERILERDIWDDQIVPHEKNVIEEKNGTGRLIISGEDKLFVIRPSFLDVRFERFIMHNTFDEKIASNQARFHKNFDLMQSNADPLSGFWCAVEKANKILAAAYFFKKYDLWVDGLWDYFARHFVVSKHFRGLNPGIQLRYFGKLIHGAVVLMSKTRELTTPASPFGRIRVFSPSHGGAPASMGLIKQLLRRAYFKTNRLCPFIKAPANIWR